MIRTLPFAVAAMLVATSAVAAQQMAAPSPESHRLIVALGPLGTGKIMDSRPRGTIGLFHSDLAAVVKASPEAARAAREFNHEQAVGRPALLVGAIALVGGLAAYAGRGGAVGIGGREMSAVALGAGGIMLGAERLTLSRRALARAVAAFERDRR